ncbi:hypothetical protein LTR91_023433 [Friedmanniomyces endolithicus]|uniref:Alpha/beta hydrolase fold-3 domain-containing protein n=1 Tax=Friedmanniomyces endolithicus TaxID=329885 RepID=A0AAN6H314_9PEZI|nr:hypothetical protein LTR57_024649 [Friedmanniomyces endolithicus]KAK0952008.1 hypothetical protein LTS01_025014 [Friedmanniomyces endolithicus]KAK0954189.1 hypothetical protein LTR91_023433 [Friedmanniomyces endolithicus]KAK1022197.1 hypothetical protein LTS16_025907 [Friedmanniomyces endolithicus]
MVANSSEGYTPPGRLGNPSLELSEDPRAHPKVIEALTPFGLANNAQEVPLTAESPLEHLAGYCAAAHSGFSAIYSNVPLTLPGDENEPNVEHSIETIKGVDDNDIKLHIFRKAGTEKEVLPCVVYLHGGGMNIIDNVNPVHVRWCTSLALSGVAVMMTDFRNAWTEAERNVFPAGLKDCAAAVKYIAAHKTELGIGKIITQGESGGANLAIATALKANREGWIEFIDGVFGIVPYISGAYGWSTEQKIVTFPSMIETNGYLLDMGGLAALAAYYTESKDATNPLAWPYYASEKDLIGLPPHILLMDELDPLRSEGQAFFRKLTAAGVSVLASVTLGTTHGSSLMFRAALPELHNGTVASIAAFAKRVS